MLCYLKDKMRNFLIHRVAHMFLSLNIGLHAVLQYVRMLHMNGPCHSSFCHSQFSLWRYILVCECGKSRAEGVIPLVWRGHKCSSDRVQRPCDGMIRPLLMSQTRCTHARVPPQQEGRLLSNRHARRKQIERGFRAAYLCLREA